MTQMLISVIHSLHTLINDFHLLCHCYFCLESKFQWLFHTLGNVLQHGEVTAAFGNAVVIADDFPSCNSKGLSSLVIFLNMEFSQEQQQQQK